MHTFDGGLVSSEDGGSSDEYRAPNLRSALVIGGVLVVILLVVAVLLIAEAVGGPTTHS
jgi:hypothetical protein